MEFSNLNDWESKYQHIIELGKKMDHLSDVEKVEDLKIKGCQSQVWLKATLDDGKINFKADSDALITRGLIAILLKYYSNLTPRAVVNAQPNFLDKIGLRDHLSPSRANGLNSMIRQIKFYGMAFEIKQKM